MEGRLGVEFEPAALRAAIEHSNHAREYYCKTLDLLKTKELPGVSRELHEIFGMNYFGAKENAQLCKVLYEEALELVEEEPNRKKRVLWIGQVPEESHELLQHMRQVVDVVYWAPLWEGNRVMLDEYQPFESMAHRAILYHWSAERMSADILWVCENYEIEGFLVAYEWGCRNMMGVSPTLRDLAKDRGITYLSIDIDMVDRSNNYAFNHIKNRVDAFLEILQ